MFLQLNVRASLESFDDFLWFVFRKKRFWSHAVCVWCWIFRVKTVFISVYNNKAGMLYTDERGKRFNLIITPWKKLHWFSGNCTICSTFFTVCHSHFAYQNIQSWSKEPWLLRSVTARWQLSHSLLLSYWFLHRKCRQGIACLLLNKKTPF